MSPVQARRTLVLGVSLSLLLGCAQPPRAPVTAPPSAPAEAPLATVSLYRGLKLDANGRIDWSAASFGVSGFPATLSLFDSPARFPNPARIDCWLKFEVVLPGPLPPRPQSTAVLRIPALADAPAAAQPGPWTVVFDGDPPGHWSIAAAQIGSGMKNAAASRWSAQVFAAMRESRSAELVDGAAADCAAR